MAAPRIIVGDCVEQMAAMPEASVDAIVTDPPYGLEFMGRDWDSFAPERGRTTAAPDGAPAGGFTRDGSSWEKMRGGTAAPTTRRCMRCQGWTGTFSKAREARQKRCECPSPSFPSGAPMTMLAFQRWTHDWGREALRVLKPGGHLLAFGGTRTYHRLAAGIEDAGFEIRDTIAWMYGSGFPKSLDVSKAIDSAAGAERTPKSWINDNGHRMHEGGAGGNARCPDCKKLRVDHDHCTCPRDDGPQTPDAERWQGWGTALKPAFEPIVVARKPLTGTVASNVLAHGTGALNIDGCRIGSSEVLTGGGGKLWSHYRDGTQDRAEPRVNEGMGRWPANVVLDQEAARLLDQQTGELVTNPGTQRQRGQAIDGWGTVAQTPAGKVLSEGDKGGASRFFYVAKPSGSERGAGLGYDGERNSHPTVKPVELMRWLVRLVTPPGGTVLDPFMGSGTTGCAAMLERVTFVGIEQDADYAKIAQARIDWWRQHPDGVSLVKRIEAEKTRKAVAKAGQLDMFASLEDDAA